MEFISTFTSDLCRKTCFRRLIWTLQITTAMYFFPDVFISQDYTGWGFNILQTVYQTPAVEWDQMEPNRVYIFDPVVFHGRIFCYFNWWILSLIYWTYFDHSFFHWKTCVRSKLWQSQIIFITTVNNNLTSITRWVQLGKWLLICTKWDCWHAAI